MSRLRFTKMEGAGNDYLYVNLFEEEVSNPSELAKRLSHRRFGIGADGLVLIAPSEVADLRMIMFNADGSQAEMCGNAIRCVAKYGFDRGLVHHKRFTIETLDGIKELEVLPDSHNMANLIKVNMGVPVTDAPKIPSTLPPGEALDQELDFGDFRLTGSLVSMGNPHFVTFVEDPGSLNLEQMGPKVEHASYFPNRINTEFCKVLSPKEVDQRTWERGSGETWACGTGASAVAVAGILTGRLESPVVVHLKGGDLMIEWAGPGQPLFMTGGATEVFEGSVEI